jgi:hypothetical protein
MSQRSPLVADGGMRQTKALPNGAANTSTNGFDLEQSTRGSLTGMKPELYIEAPALNVTEQPNSKTMIYSVEHADDSAFSGVAVLYSAVLTQTGAGGAGAAAATRRLALPTDVKRYVRVKATGSASGDSSTKSMTVSLLF